MFGPLTEHRVVYLLDILSLLSEGDDVMSKVVGLSKVVYTSSNVVPMDDVWLSVDVAVVLSGSAEIICTQ